MYFIPEDADSSRNGLSKHILTLVKTWNKHEIKRLVSYFNRNTWRLYSHWQPIYKILTIVEIYKGDLFFYFELYILIEADAKQIMLCYKIR